MTPPTSTTNVSVLATQVENLADAFKSYTQRNDKNMDDIKGLLERLSESLNAVITTDGDRAVRLAQLEEWKKGIDAQMVGSKDDRQTLWRKVDKLDSQLSLVRWVGGLLGGGVVTWVLANLLGLIR